MKAVRIIPLGLMACALWSPAAAQTYTFGVLAGLTRVSGSSDGGDGDARFNSPAGVAVDRFGNVYVADTNNHAIRKISPSGLVSTVAGLAGNTGSADGPGTSARFFAPFGLAVDAADNLYVAEAGNHTVRKVTPAGVVSTIAGRAGTTGSTDGTGASARFGQLAGLAGRAPFM